MFYMTGYKHIERPLRVGVAGVGALGSCVCLKLLDGVPGITLSAIASRDPTKLPATLRFAGLPNVELAELPELVDVVVECLSPSAFRSLAIPTLRLGRIKQWHGNAA
jgi:aspartate dehydrogenase